MNSSNLFLSSSKTTLFFFKISILPISLLGQSCETDEIRLNYTNAIEICNVCRNNPQMDFDENKEYFWYTEFSGVKSTKGGCGGNLLNGNYKLYDDNGNLLNEKNYSLGVAHGNQTEWDSIGNINNKVEYDHGKVTYWKFLNDEGYWIEHEGAPLMPGSVKRVYTELNRLIEKSLVLEDFYFSREFYYVYPSDQLRKKYTTYGSDEFLVGEYKSYFKNGKIEVEGQFYKGEKIFLSLKDGTWKWYNSDGTLDSIEEYKAEVSKWENGELKTAGTFIFNDNIDKWVEMDEWKWWNEQGELIRSVTYDFGTKISQ